MLTEELEEICAKLQANARDEILFDFWGVPVHLRDRAASERVDNAIRSRLAEIRKTCGKLKVLAGLNDNSERMQ